MRDVLLIEPDQYLAESLAAGFKRDGWAVQQCRHGQAAIEEIDEQAPAVVVVSAHLPEYNVVNFLHELRTYQDLLDIPVVVTSVGRLQGRIIDAISNSFWPITVVDISRTHAIELCAITAKLVKAHADISR